MDEKIFHRELRRAQTMQKLAAAEDEPYWRGYIRGLRRRHHGEAFGTAREHALFLRIKSKTPDRRRLGAGYRDGFEGVPVTPTRCRWLQVRVSADEADNIAAEAATAGKSVSEYVRDRALKRR